MIFGESDFIEGQLTPQPKKTLRECIENDAHKRPQ